MTTILVWRKCTSSTRLVSILLALLVALAGCRPLAGSVPAPTATAEFPPQPTVTEEAAADTTPASAAPERIPTATAHSVDRPTPLAGLTPVASIYDETIPETRAERIIISEIFLMREAGELLLETDWDGDNGTPLPLSIEQFDQERLEAYIADERQDDRALTIPRELEDFYTGQESITDLQALIVRANEEYAAYLAAKEVLPDYIEELARVLPATAERMVYHAVNDPNADPTAVEALEVPSEGTTDHSRLQLDVYPADIYNRVLLLEASRILGEPPGDPDAYEAYHLTLRDMATRQLIYHEMTHALQRAYTNLHVEDEEERTLPGAWLSASKTLLADVDTQYHWTWGDPFFAQSYNNDVSGESQAEGISYEVLVNLYEMSDAQKAAVWDHYFGRYERSREALWESRALFEEAYPAFSADDLGDLLPEVMDQYPDPAGRNLLWQVAFRLIALPAYVGYLNPMEPDDAPKFWEALREE